MAVKQTPAPRCPEPADRVSASSPRAVKHPSPQNRPPERSFFCDHVSEPVNANPSRGNDATVWAVLAHLQRAAGLAIDHQYEDAKEHTTAALSICGTLTSQLGALARTMHGIMRLNTGDAIELDAEIAVPMSLLVDEKYLFTLSPEVAYVIGLGAVVAGYPKLANDWCRWIRQRADITGDLPLGVASRLVQCAAAIASCYFADAKQMADDAAVRANEVGLVSLASRASSLSRQLALLLDDGGTSTEVAALVLPAALGTDPLLKVGAQISLALSDMLARRRSMSLAWLRSAVEMVPQVCTSRVFTEFPAPVLGTLLLITGSQVEARKLLEAIEPSVSTMPDRQSTFLVLQGIVATDLDRALDLLREAATGIAPPMIQALAELCAGIRLEASSCPGDGQLHLETARRAFEEIGAHGFARLIEQEFPMKKTVNDVVRESEQIRAAPDTTANRTQSGPFSSEQAWEITMLGGFNLYRHGTKIAFPRSRAAQAIKIVAVSGFLSIDTLVELLWSGSEPGVGIRRLRNVLWRIRSSLGDLLERDGDCISLSAQVSTDIARFRVLATNALDYDCPDGEAVELADKAVAIYRGTLLPDDLYADWTRGYRDGLSLLYVRLLDLLLANSLDEGKLDLSLRLLEKLIAVEPFEESYYIQEAELFTQSGHLSRARSTLKRACDVMTELGVAPCPALSLARQRLSFD